MQVNIKHCGICIFMSYHHGRGCAGTWWECEKGVKELEMFNKFEAVKENKTCDMFILNTGETKHIDHR